MENLIENVIKNDFNKKKSNESNKKIKNDMIKKINPILEIMNEAEVLIINNKKDKSISNLNPIPKQIYNIEKMSISKSILKIKELRNDCDGFYFKSFKIPLSYFNMNKQDILETHKKWSNSYLDKTILKNKNNLIKYKTKRIKELQKELEDLKK